MERAAQHGEFGIRCYDIDCIGLDGLCVDRFPHRHRRGTLQQLSQERLVRRIHVLDDHVSEAAACRNARQELLEWVEAAGGRAQSHNAQPRAARGPRRSGMRGVFHAQVCSRPADRSLGHA